MTSPESGSYASGPLSGLRVLDLSWLLPGPLCTGILADLGADVIKIERPSDGDYARTMLPGLFQLVNRGKRSAVVDLRTPQGRETVLKLAERADVFVEGFRPGVMARLGVGYEHIRARHQGIVYVSLSGYGQTGPAANEPGHDVNYCGRAGLMAIPVSVTQADEPSRMQLPVSDIAGAMYAAVSTLAALRERDRTGEGQWLDVSLAEAALAWSGLRWADAPADAAGQWRHVRPMNDIFTAADGVRLAVALVETHFWHKFINELPAPEREHLQAAGETPRACHAALQAIFAARPSAQWLDFAKTHDLPISRIAASLEDIVSDPHFSARGAWLPAENGQRPMPAFPVRVRGAPRHGKAPEFGEATEMLGQLWGVSL
ncbi:CaiB/BaiF CoA-transferase family protein [Acidocella sp.]|uniref:CaiB/BaiF CoA transferase family protein n=1 Tax=Acidocella sp. TaxID=50710 RepID=UPI0026385D79|nr:CoA transferase [Acidocella sp.]